MRPSPRRAPGRRPSPPGPVKARRSCARLGSLIAQKPTKRRISSAVEQRFCKPKVGGSIPSSGTNIFNNLLRYAKLGLPRTGEHSVVGKGLLRFELRTPQRLGAQTFDRIPVELTTCAISRAAPFPKRSELARDGPLFGRAGRRWNREFRCAGARARRRGVRVGASGRRTGNSVRSAAGSSIASSMISERRSTPWSISVGVTEPKPIISARRSSRDGTMETAPLL